MTNSDLQSWVGRKEVSQDLLRADPARFMQATLDQDPNFANGDALPPLWHWLYFLEAKRLSELGRDAHPRKGGFLPPVPLPRRMWAGGRFTFHRPLIIGQTSEKSSQILSVTEKEGRSGKLCFVTVEHRITQNEQLAIIEEQDIVYREDPQPSVQMPPLRQAPNTASISREISPSEVLLFRYSALTFNGHRIHYDVDYARHVEGYDGLVFHGPLTATLLVDLACDIADQPPKTFSFRGLAPISGGDPFRIEGRVTDGSVDLWAKRADGALAMTATTAF